MPDEEERGAVLTFILLRESNSKELDSALLAIVSFPAFAWPIAIR
jgi:hypothetical protein